MEDEQSAGRNENKRKDHLSFLYLGTLVYYPQSMLATLEIGGTYETTVTQ